MDITDTYMLKYEFGLKLDLDWRLRKTIAH